MDNTNVHRNGYYTEVAEMIDGPTSEPVDDRDGFELAAEVVDQLLAEIDRVRHVHRLDRYTAVQVVAILFGSPEEKLLRLTGETP